MPAEGADGTVFVYHISFLSSSLMETARYRQKFCLEKPLTPQTNKQTTKSKKKKKKKKSQPTCIKSELTYLRNEFHFSDFHYRSVNYTESRAKLVNPQRAHANFASDPL